jgi:hypothetical protein
MSCTAARCGLALPFVEQSPAFGGNPILQRTDLDVRDANAMTNVATGVDGLSKPSTVSWTLSTEAVNALDLDNEIQFRVTIRDTKTKTWYTNNDDGYVCSSANEKVCAVCERWWRYGEATGPTVWTSLTAP